MTQPIYFTAQEDVPELGVTAGDAVSFHPDGRVIVTRYLDEHLSACDFMGVIADGTLLPLERESAQAAPRLTLVR